MRAHPLSEKCIFIVDVRTINHLLPPSAKSDHQLPYYPM